ncbi:MAG: helix-turn-helix domain-containing protein [Nitrospinaceae bacterium]|nr:helix-turn-helix domain-containing protein [Nitrospinaceae bacterium]MBT3823321.1 helix-turn-helix domain-containing protein [Nitrospinaceae bacterium]MBT4429867.1 helix-turn-helix domain-containing protein [Nitrospinaceae bacterium]MBT5946305.1 helix-turn-helix domain-containing protein [Nitrospinaceae bacterium]MBT7856367.1 helix-turn-helix domain-containing protein [Nitrospinaceae bacterium]
MSSSIKFSGKRLRGIREEKKLTRAAVAAATGLAPEDIDKIESSELDPTIGQLHQITEALEISLADLLSLPPIPLECRISLTSGEDAAARQAASRLIPVPVVSGEIAAGNARIVDDAILGWLFLPAEEFTQRSSNLVAVKVSGQSMEPDLADGCVAVVDRNDRVIMPDSIFAVRDMDGGCTVKYIEVLDPGHIALIPANRQAFKVEFMKLQPGESFSDRVIGRVIWAGQSFISGNEAAENSPPYGHNDLGRASDLRPSSLPKRDESF